MTAFTVIEHFVSSTHFLVAIDGSVDLPGGCPRMRFRSLRLPAQTLRNLKKIMLAGKRRLRYPTYGCAYFFKISRF